MPPKSKKGDKKGSDASAVAQSEKSNAVPARTGLSPPELEEPPGWHEPPELTTVDSLLEEWNDDTIAKEDWGLASAAPFTDKFGVPELPASMQNRVKEWVRLADYAAPPERKEMVLEEPPEPEEEDPKKKKDDKKKKPDAGAVAADEGGAFDQELVDRDVDTAGKLLPRVVVPAVVDLPPSAVDSSLAETLGSRKSVASSGGAGAGGDSQAGLLPALAISASQASLPGGPLASATAADPNGPHLRQLARGFRRENPRALGFSAAKRPPGRGKFPVWADLSEVPSADLPEEADTAVAAIFRTVHMLRANLEGPEGGDGEGTQQEAVPASRPRSSRGGSVAGSAAGSAAGGDTRPGSVNNSSAQRPGTSSAAAKAKPAVSSGRDAPSPYLWEAIYPQDYRGRPCFNPAGKYVVRLWAAGKWRRVVVDDRVPVDAALYPVWCHSALRRELWPALLAKALRKLYAVLGLARRRPEDGAGPEGAACFAAVGAQALTGWAPRVDGGRGPRGGAAASWDLLGALGGGGTPALSLDLFALANPFPEPSDWEVLQRRKARLRVEALYPHKKKERAKHKEKDIRYTPEELEEIVTERNWRIDAMAEAINSRRDEVFLVSYWEEDEAAGGPAADPRASAKSLDEASRASDISRYGDGAGAGLRLVTCPVLACGVPPPQLLHGDGGGGGAPELTGTARSRVETDPYLLLGWEDLRLLDADPYEEALAARREAEAAAAAAAAAEAGPPGARSSFAAGRSQQRSRAPTAASIAADLGASGTLGARKSRKQLQAEQDAAVAAAMGRVLEQDPRDKWVRLSELLRPGARPHLARLRPRGACPERAALVLPRPAPDPTAELNHKAALEAHAAAAGKGGKKGSVAEAGPPPPAPLPTPPVVRFLRVASGGPGRGPGHLVLHLWKEEGGVTEGVPVLGEEGEKTPDPPPTSDGKKSGKDKDKKSKGKLTSEEEEEKDEEALQRAAAERAAAARAAVRQGAELVLQEVAPPGGGALPASRRAVFARVHIPPGSVPFQSVRVALGESDGAGAARARGEGAAEEEEGNRLSAWLSLGSLGPGAGALGSVAEATDESSQAGDTVDERALRALLAMEPVEEGELELDPRDPRAAALAADLGLPPPAAAAAAAAAADRVFKVTLRGPAGTTAAFFGPGALQVAPAPAVWEGLGGQALAHGIDARAVAQGEWRVLLGYKFRVGKGVANASAAASRASLLSRGGQSQSRSSLALGSAGPGAASATPSKPPSARPSVGQLKEFPEPAEGDEDTPATQRSRKSLSRQDSQSSAEARTARNSGVAAGEEEQAPAQEEEAPLPPHTNLRLFLSLLDESAAPFIRLVVVDNDSGEADTLPTLHSPELRLFQNRQGYTVFALADCARQALPRQTMELHVLARGPELLTYPRAEPALNLQCFGGTYSPNAEYLLFRDVLAASDPPVSLKLWTPVPGCRLRLTLRDPNNGDEVLAEARAARAAEIVGFRAFKKMARRSSVYENQNAQVVVEAALDFRRMEVPAALRAAAPHAFTQADPERMRRLRAEHLQATARRFRPQTRPPTPAARKEEEPEKAGDEEGATAEGGRKGGSKDALEKTPKEKGPSRKSLSKKSSLASARSMTSARSSLVEEETLQGEEEGAKGPEEEQPPAGAGEGEPPLEVPWFLEVVSGGEVVLAHDTARLEQEAAQRAAWERRDPGRAARAEVVRRAYFEPPALPPREEGEEGGEGGASGAAGDRGGGGRGAGGSKKDAKAKGGGGKKGGGAAAAGGGRPGTAGGGAEDPEAALEGLDEGLRALLQALPADPALELRRRRRREELALPGSAAAAAAAGGAAAGRVPYRVVECGLGRKPRLPTAKERKERQAAHNKKVEEAEAFMEGFDKQLQADIGAGRKKITELIAALNFLEEAHSRVRKEAMDEREEYVVAKLNEFEKRSQHMIEEFEEQNGVVSAKKVGKKK